MQKKKNDFQKVQPLKEGKYFEIILEKVTFLLILIKKYENYTYLLISIAYD